MKLLITGGSGLIGSAIQKIHKSYNYEFIFLSSKDCNLEDFKETDILFNNIKPDYVIHLAACVGGLFKNLKYKVDMLEKNVMINNNVLKCSHKYNVKKVISCLSTCIFPDKTSYPINENMLHNGPPHNSNNAYAYAKRLLEIQSIAYQEQYNKNFICVIPTNIYGPNDNFSLEDGHCIPSLIHRCYIAKREGTPFKVLGTGKPLRQFIYSEDLAILILWVLEKYNKRDSIILSVNKEDEVSINDIVKQISISYDYDNIKYDKSYSDGQYKKTADNNKLRKIYGKLKFTKIDEGIKNTVDWFIKNYDGCRK
jgi:GDP-L-fucose synthase